MEKKQKSLFTNDKFFMVCALIAFLGQATSALLIASTERTSAIVSLICAICSLWLYVSYRSHAKNIMKGMMGALLMAFFINAVTRLDFMNDTVSGICVPICAVLTGILFINHFFINESRYAKPINIRISQWSALLLALNMIVMLVYAIINAGGDVAKIASSAAYLVAYPCALAAIVCVESKLDAYRIKREGAGWSEEAGYPEDYDRKGNYGK